MSHEVATCEGVGATRDYGDSRARSAVLIWNFKCLVTVSMRCGCLRLERGELDHDVSLFG